MAKQLNFSLTARNGNEVGLNSKKMATYVLISTVNAAQNGWAVYCEGTKAQCQVCLDKEFNGTDIWADTLRKNARIVSKSTAKRQYGLFDDRELQCGDPWAEEC